MWKLAKLSDGRRNRVIKINRGAIPSIRRDAGHATQSDVYAGLVEKLKQVLTMNDKNILEHAGSISHKLAMQKLLTNMINTRWHKSSWSIWRVSKSWSRMFRNCVRLKNEDSELLIFLYFCRVF